MRHAEWIAQQRFDDRGDGFAEEGRAGLADDDGHERAGEQPHEMEESAQSRGEAVEQGGRDGVDEVPGPEDHAGCDGNDRGHDDVDHTPFDVGFANCGRLVFFSHIGMCLSLMQRHGK